MTQLNSGSITNTKATNTEYDSQFTVSPIVTTTYKVESYNDSTRYKTCIVKVPNVAQVILKYSTISSETMTPLSTNTSITLNNGDYLYVGYEVIGDGTIDIPVSYQDAIWSDDSSHSKTKTIHFITNGVTTINAVSTHNDSIVSHTLTVSTVTPTPVVNALTIDKQEVTINSGESVTINSMVSGQYLTNGINVYYEQS